MTVVTKNKDDKVDVHINVKSINFNKTNFKEVTICFGENGLGPLLDVSLSCIKGIYESKFKEISGEY